MKGGEAGKTQDATSEMRWVLSKWAVKAEGCPRCLWPVRSVRLTRAAPSPQLNHIFDLHLAGLLFTTVAGEEGGG